MRSANNLLSLLSLLTSLLTLSQPILATSSPASLNITALTAINGSSVIQCWQLPPFAISTTPGTIGARSLNLGNTANATYQIIPGYTNAGLHNAPVPQLVLFTSGLIRLSIPNTTQEAYIIGGKHGLIFAEDTAERSVYGHLTEYVGQEETVVVVLPLEMKGEEKERGLEHRVLHDGGCEWREVGGL